VSENPTTIHVVNEPVPGVPTQFWIWIRIGIESFGGGSGTRLNLYRAIVERGRWMTPLEFAQAWSICQLAPGISLIALASLIGWRFSKAIGLIAALTGLLLPSCLITVAITALYLRLQTVELIRAGLHGVVAAVLGVAFANVILTARPLLISSLAHGRATLGFGTLIVIMSAVLTAFGDLPVALILIGAGTFMSLWSLAQGRN
jgi:chromate transporter